MGDMKNIVVLKNLPSNMIEEAFVVLKENKKMHKCQVVDAKNNKNEDEEKKEDNKYIIKEAEMLVKTYTEGLVKESPKWKNNMKKLERRYKTSVKLNFLLLFTTVVGIVMSIINC